MDIIQRLSPLKIASLLLWLPILILALLFYTLTFPPVSERILASFLQSQGLEGISFSVQKVSLNSLVLGNVAVEGEATAKKIDVTYSIESLLKSRVLQIRVTGVEANAVVENGEIVSSFFNSLKGNKGNEMSSGLILLPFDVFVVEEGTLNLALEGKQYRFDVNADTRYQQEGKHLANLKVEGGEEGAKGTMNALIQWNLEEVSGNVTFAGEVASLPLSPDASLEGATLNLTMDMAFQKEKLEVKLQKGRLAARNLFVDKGKGLFRTPFSLSLNEEKRSFVLLDMTDASGMKLNYSLAFQDVEASLDLPQEKKSLQAEIYLYLAGLSGSALLSDQAEKQAFDLNYDIQEGWFQLPAYKLEGNRLFLHGAINREIKGSGRVKGELSHTDEPPYLNVVALTGDFRHAPDFLRFKGAFHDLFEKLKGAFQVAYRLDTKGGTASVSIDPLVFSPTENPLSSISPFAAQFVKKLAGRVGVQGEFAFDQKGLRPNLSISLNDVSLLLGETRIAGITSSLSIDGLSPLTTKEGQEASIAKIDLPAPLEKVMAVLSVDAETVGVSSLKGEWMKGKVNVEPFVINRKTSFPDGVTVSLQEIDLAEVLRLVNQPGLSGKGTLKGKIPVDFQPDGSFSINGGILEGNGEKGILRYMPDDATYALSEGNKNMNLLFHALEDFHYERLQVLLGGNSTESLKASLHVRGANPNLYNGRIVELNIELGGALLELIKSAIGFYALPDTLKKRYDNRT